VDELRECRPSAESAEEFYELTTKSPLRLIAIDFNGLCINAATFRSPALQPVGPAVVAARGRAGEVHIFLRRATSTDCSAGRCLGRTMMEPRGARVYGMHGFASRNRGEDRLDAAQVRELDRFLAGVSRAS